MIDVHCHLVDAKYQDIKVQTIVDEAHKAGVQIIANGVRLMENKKQIEISEQNNGIWVCVGVAYESGSDNFKNIKEQLRKMCKHPKVVGIGEAGLNYYAGMSEKLKNYQIKLFETHLELARELDLPIEVHNRGADLDIYNLICKYRIKTLLHCFSGTEDFMKIMADLGCYFSFGGMITYKKNENIRRVVKLVPQDRLLLETDSPYLSPEPLRGTINTPTNVKIVAERMAQIRGITESELERLTSENTQRLFGKI